MFAIFRNRALCVAVSVLNKCIMARNSMANMVIGASNVGGAAGGIGDVGGGLIEVVTSIDDAAGVGGTDFEGSSSCCAYSACAGIGDAGLGGATSSVE